MVRPLASVLVLLLGWPLRAQDDYAARLQALEGILAKYYRGERLELAVDRADRGVEAYNAMAKKRQAELDLAKVQLELTLSSGREDRARLEVLDRELKNLTLPQDQIRHRVEERNALVLKINAQTAKHRQAVDAYNQQVRDTMDDLDRERKRVLAVQDAVNRRLADYEAFSRDGQDAAFFIALNRLLADLRQTLRAHPADAYHARLLAQVREYRQVLANWAQEGQALRANGLVIVEALIGDERCWLVVDSGAMDTILSPEIVDAIGLGGSLGKESTLSVVGGVRVSGRAVRIPRIEVNGQVAREVPATAVLPSDVGIDGLLGQTFLKRFVYTIDERSSRKLQLIPK